MTDHMPDDLSATGRDLRAYTDELRARHRIGKNITNEWVLLHHKDVVEAALDHPRFSSAVSRYLQVPNGLDGEEHQIYRALVDRFLTPDALQPFVPEFQRIANELINQFPLDGKTIEAVHDIGAVYAVRAQCAWLGWPTDLETRLLQWMQENHAATRSGEQARTQAVAEEFDDIIRLVLKHVDNSDQPSVTKQLCQTQVKGRALTEAERVSILRNWTGGDLGSMALCVGVIIAYLVQHPNQTQLFQQLRQASDNSLELFIDEVLRLDNPFVSNRRITTCPVQIAGKELPQGAKVKLNWTSANRDETVFENNEFNPEKHAPFNLVYGIGKHVCPGRTLATWQLRIALRTLLAKVNTIQLCIYAPLEREIAPVGGYYKVPIILG